MIFKKGCRTPANVQFHYNNGCLEIVNTCLYLGIVFPTGGSFSEAQQTLFGQSLKAVYTINKYLCKFTNLSVSHELELFDKLVLPILNHGSEFWGF